MSLILDALNKNEREQNIDHNKVPDINTQHAQVVSESGGNLQKWWYLAVGVLAVLVVALAATLILRSGAPLEASDQEPAAMSKAAVPASKASSDKILAQGAIERPSAEIQSAPPVKLKATPEAVPKADSVQQDIQSLYEPQIDSKPQVIYEPKVKEVVEDSSFSQVDSEHAAAIWAEMQKLNGTPDWEQEQESIEEEALARKEESAEDEIPEDIAQEDRMSHYADVPFLHELPVTFQNAIPTLMYNAHKFEPGSVVLNKKSYSAGDTLPSGVRLERVLFDGVLLNFQGKRFKLSALSSWVNF